MAVKKPYISPKFIGLSGAPYRGADPYIVSKGDVREKVMAEGAEQVRHDRRDETVYIYQLVAVCKPKPIEFIVETFAVCKAPPAQKESQ